MNLNNQTVASPCCVQKMIAAITGNLGLGSPEDLGNWICSGQNIRDELQNKQVKLEVNVKSNALGQRLDADA